MFIRMLEDREGAPDHLTIVTYRAGEVYSLASTDPPISQDLLDGFIVSGHAVEVDEQGNPIATPADKRQTKPTGPAASKTSAPVLEETPPVAPDAPPEPVSDATPPAPPPSPPVPADAPDTPPAPPAPAK